MKHFIPDWSTFVSLGYDISSIHHMEDAEVDAFPEGDNVKQIVEEKIDKHPFGQCPCITDDTYLASLNVTANMRPHLICFDENEESLKLYKQHYFLHHNNISQKLIQYNESVETSYEDCDVIMRINNQLPTTKYMCPEQCGPKPIVEISLSWLTSPHRHNLTEMITCSMTFAELLRETKTHQEAERPEEASATGTGTAGMPGIHHTHHQHKTFGSVTSILKAIAKRRIEECLEPHLWTSGSVHMAANYKTIHKVHRHSIVYLFSKSHL